MKLTILKEVLSRKLGLASKFLLLNPTLSILGTVLLKATDRLEITVSNLEAGIRLLVDCKVEQSGSVAIPAKKFIDFVSGLPNEKIVMSLNEKSLTFNIKCGKQEANIKCRDPEDFPVLPIIDTTPLITIQHNELLKMIKPVAPSAAVDNGRPCLDGIHFATKNSRLHIEATDGFRASFNSVSGSGTEIEAIVGSLSVAKMVSTFENGDSISIAVAEGNKMVFYNMDITIFIQEIEGNYPDVAVLIPETTETMVTINRAEFLRIIKSCHIFAKERNSTIKLVVLDSELIVSSSGKSVVSDTGELVTLGSGEDDYEGRIDIDNGVAPAKIKLNSVFLQTLLKSLSCEDITIGFNGPSDPIKIRTEDKSFTYIIMPMHLAEGE